MTELTLRPYQEEALAALHSGYNAGDQRLLTVLPTGAGKTVVFAHLIRDLGGRALVVAHRDELIRQTAQKVRMVDPSANVGIVKADDNHYWADVVIASIQTIQNAKRRDQLGRFDLIVTDEAHHATARTWMETVEALGGFEDGGPKVSGWTATPDRTDKVGLGAVFQRVAYERGLLDLICDGYLVDPRPLQILLERLDLSDVRTQNGDLAAGATGQALIEADAPEHIAEALETYADDRRALVFMPTVDAAQRTADAIAETGRPAAMISGATPQREREAALAGIQSGKITALVNCMVLTEGTDLPAVDCIVVGRPTKSRSLYQQMIGRGLRLYPGKEDCLILDMVGVSGRHKLVTAADLFGLPPKMLEGRTVTQAQAEQARQEAILSKAAGRLVAVNAEAFGVKRAHWVPSGNGTFLLSVGIGMIVLAPAGDGDLWDVTLKPAAGWKRPESLAGALSLEYAQGLAEDYARRQGAAVLIDPDAPWRLREVTERQAWALRKMGLDPRDYRTAGAASDAISAAKGRA